MTPTLTPTGTIFHDTQRTRKPPPNVESGLFTRVCGQNAMRRKTNDPFCTAEVTSSNLVGSTPLSLRFDNDLVLGEGMVYSVEPGIYIPGLGGFREPPRNGLSEKSGSSHRHGLSFETDDGWFGCRELFIRANFNSTCRSPDCERLHRTRAGERGR